MRVDCVSTCLNIWNDQRQSLIIVVGGHDRENEQPSTECCHPTYFFSKERAAGASLSTLTRLTLTVRMSPFIHLSLGLLCMDLSVVL